MVLRDHSIGQAQFFYARAYAHTRTVTLTICLVFSAFASFAADPAFIRGAKGSIRGLELNYTAEARTRSAMKVQTNCLFARKQAIAAPMTGKAGAILMPHLKAQKGVVILEAVMADGSFKTLYTALPGAYKNFPVAVPGDDSLKSAYPLAMTFAAALPDQGDMAIQKGDSIGLKIGSQLYAYGLPALTIRKGGLLRLYVGTDDTLYYDAGLKHPLHEGICKKRAK